MNILKYKIKLFSHFFDLFKLYLLFLLFYKIQLQLNKMIIIL